MFYRFRLTGFKTTDSGHIYVSGFEQTAAHIAIDGFLTDSELIRVVGEDVMNGLAALDQGRDQLIQLH